MTTKTLIAGVGMVKFTKPGKNEQYDIMGAKAAISALEDSGIAYKDVQQAYVGFVNGDTCSGQTALYGLGLTGIPIINVNNACATGSTALFLACQAVASGAVDVALAEQDQMPWDEGVFRSRVKYWRDWFIAEWDNVKSAPPFNS